MKPPRFFFSEMSYLERLMDTIDIYQPSDYGYDHQVITKLLNNYRSHDGNMILLEILFCVFRKIEFSLGHTRGITPKRVTSDGVHFHSLAPGQHSSEET